MKQIPPIIQQTNNTNINHNDDDDDDGVYGCKLKMIPIRLQMLVILCDAINLTYIWVSNHRKEP